MKRHLAGNSEQLRIKTAKQGERLVARDDLARHHPGVEDSENRISGERRERLGGGKRGEILAFAQRQQPAT